MSPQASDWEVCVSWEQFEKGTWRPYARKPQFFTLAAKAREAYTEELNTYGHLDPGREDIRDVLIELRYQGQRVDHSDTPCTPERTRYWLDRVAEVLAKSHGPLAKGLRGMA